MKHSFIWLLLAAASCTAPPSSPAAFLATLDELPTGQVPRLYLTAGEPPRWALPMPYDEFPSSVGRTVETVLQDGELRFAGRVYGGPEDAYLVEKLYPVLGSHHLRRALVASDGRVLLRSHTLPIAEAPDPVAKRISARGELESLEFVEGRASSYYRAIILEAGALRRVRAYTPEGSLLRVARLLSVQANVFR